MNPAELNLNPLSQIDPVVIGIVAVIMIALYLLLRRFYVLPYLEVMEAREELFSIARGRTSEAEQIRRDSDMEAEAVLTAAAASAEGLRSAAQARADAYRKERIAEASLEASESLDKGRAELREARDSERASVRVQAVECVSVACHQLLGSADPEAIESTVTRVMEHKTG
jgi:F0F1-type ATP synthase membrane subunit b/b'